MKYRFAIYFLIYSQVSFSQFLRIDEALTDYTIFYQDTKDLIRRIKINDGIRAEYHIADLVLYLESQNTIGDSYRSVNSRGEVSDGTPLDVLTLTGHTLYGDRASLTVGDGFIYGVIDGLNGHYYIEPLSIYEEQISIDEFIFYHSNNLNLNTSAICGASKQQETTEALQPYFKKMSVGLCYTVEYAIVHDYSMISKYGSTELAEAFAIGVTNAVNTNYDDEFSDEVLIQITGQYSINCVGCEPWSVSSDPNQILNNFTNWAGLHLDENPINIHHDVASLWTDIDLDENVVGVAYLGGTCNSTRYNVLQDFQGSPEEKRVLMAHELGHNFNALHDASGSNYIMAPTITVTDQWSQNSLLRIEAFYKDAQCLDICPGVMPQVNFQRNEVHVMETGVEVNESCNYSYTSINAGIELSHIIDDTVVVVIEADPTSTATYGSDYLFRSDTINFYANGPLTHLLPIEILDDKVPEDEENILFNVSVYQGQAELGSGSIMNVVVHNVGDEVSSMCCSNESMATYGFSEYQFNGIFYGTQDANTRTLLRAEDLHAYGLTSGYIDQLSLFVALKNSNGSYENFRIGMKQVNLVELGQNWYNTTEVFRGDVVTEHGQWNDFSFHTPFYWDGNSDLYIDFCFDNREGIGRDYILAWEPSNQGYDLYSFRAENYADGCQLTTGTFFYHQDRNPYIKFRKVIGAIWETAITSPTAAILNAGDTAHFYSENEKIIASVYNLGTEDLGCTELQIYEEGSGRNPIPSSTGYYSQKNLIINVGNEYAYYELILYFTGHEMNVWSNSLDELSILQSDSEIDEGNSQTNNYGIYQLIQGQGTGIDYKVITTLRGSGYIALTDQPGPSADVIVESGNFIIEGSNSGIILNSSGGLKYKIHPYSGNLVSDEYDQSNCGNSISNGDLYLLSEGTAIYYHDSEGDYHSISINNNGSVILTENVPAPVQSISIPQGHLSLESEGKGIIFNTNQEYCWKIVVEESGQLLTIKVKCPN